MIIRLVAATMLAAEIVIHADLAPDHLREIPYIGVGFVLACVLLTLAVLGVLADRAAGWLLGAITATHTRPTVATTARSPGHSHA